MRIEHDHGDGLERLCGARGHGVEGSATRRAASAVHAEGDSSGSSGAPITTLCGISRAETPAFGNSRVLTHQTQAHPAPQHDQRFTGIDDLIGQFEQALAQFSERNGHDKLPIYVRTYHNTRRGLIPDPTVVEPAGSLDAQPPSSAVIWNPQALALSTNPGNDVATFAQSAMRISSRATNPATAKLIAQR